jgi:hypothetical protein
MKWGGAISGVGDTRSLGSISLTVLSAQDYSQVRNNLSARDRARHSKKFDDFVYGFQEVIDKRPEFSGVVNLALSGLSLWGRNVKSPRPGNYTTLAFSVNPDTNPAVINDISLITTYFNNNGLPAPNLNSSKLHVSFGGVRLDRLSTGHGHDPHVIVPSGLVVPKVIIVDPIKVEDING